MRKYEKDEKPVKTTGFVEIPDNCKDCVYGTENIRDRFYDSVPPCKYVKGSDVCARWYKNIR